MRQPSGCECKYSFKASPDLCFGTRTALAQNIVDYRRENGPFASRSELKKVKRLGDTAFQQCAGFLRIPGADNPLDNSSVHPESYGIVEQMAKDQGCSVQELIGNNERIKKIKIEKYNITHKEEDNAGTGLKEQGAPFPDRPHMITMKGKAHDVVKMAKIQGSTHSVTS